MPGISGSNLAIRSPRFIHETESLLQTSFFYDADRTQLLYDDFNSLSDEELGARQLAYTSALGVLALARQEDREVHRRQGHTVNTAHWNKGWSLSPNRLREIAEREAEVLRPISRKLAILNYAERSLAEGYAEQGLYDHQLPYLNGIISAMQCGPQQVQLPSSWEERDDYRLSGILVHGPTAVGKTAIMARAAVALGVGKPPEVGWSEEADPVRILTVVPSQSLIAQLKGEVGKNIFRLLAPDVSVSAYYANERDLSGSNIFSTIPMFIKKFRDGKMDGVPIDAIFIDEVHHLLGRQFLKNLLLHWRGLTIGFTATPAYNLSKDVRNILRHEVKDKSLLEYMGATPEKRVISALRIYTLIIHPSDFEMSADTEKLNLQEMIWLQQDAMGQAACEFAEPLLAEGRRGIIFCEPGNDCEHAKRVAELLNEITLPNGKRVKAEAMGTFQGSSNSPDNKAVLSRFNSGETDVITSVHMGTEGLDAQEVNFVLQLGDVTSVLKLFQMAGRAARPSKRFPDSVLASIKTAGFNPRRYYRKTFADIFNEGIIEQGRDIYGSTGKHSEVIERPTDFSARIQRMLDGIDHKTVGEVYAGYYTEDKVSVPEDYVALHDILEGCAIDPHNARYQLLRAGYKFFGKIESVNDELQFVRYYEPAAASYFTDNPKPPEDGLLIHSLTSYADLGDLMIIDEAAELLGIHKKTLARSYLTDAEKASLKMRRINNGRPIRSWTRVEGKRIVERIKSLLVFPPHLLSVECVVNRLGVEYETVLERLRYNRETWGIAEVQRGNRKLPGVPWHILAKLEASYGLPQASVKIIYDQLPTGPDDDPAKIEYARNIQAKLGMPSSWLPTKMTWD